jgi:GT2 family glycosyltransferase
MKLFSLRWPPAGGCRELYYRLSPGGEGAAFSANGLILRKGAVLSFDTYFNCFSYPKYREYTRVHEAAVVLCVKGRAALCLMALRRRGRRTVREVLDAREVDTTEIKAIPLKYDFGNDATEGFYYPEITALDGEVYVQGGWYDYNGQSNHVKIAVVICTYKREFFLNRNLETAERDMFTKDTPEPAAHKLFTFFVIDNGGTVPAGRGDGNHILIVPNKNHGGSGGFTRGILEARARNGEFTHFLLMDDDIVFDAETLIKTARFLQVVPEGHQYLSVGGAMLRLDVPYILYEAGGIWNGLHIKHRGRGLDLREQDAVLKNERKAKRVNYQAWWYMCMPFAAVDTYGLPLPLFVNSDDIEYGLRTRGELVLMNGIGVWHEPFERKAHRLLPWYYTSRNQLIVNTLYYPHLALAYGCLKLGYLLIRGYCRGGQVAIALILRAYEDFLKGIDFLRDTDSEALNDTLAGVVGRYEQQAPRYLLSAIFTIGIKMVCQYPRAARSFRERIHEITDDSFWYTRLGM